MFAKAQLKFFVMQLGLSVSLLAWYVLSGLIGIKFRGTLYKFCTLLMLINSINSTKTMKTFKLKLLLSGHVQFLVPNQSASHHLGFLIVYILEDDTTDRLIEVANQ